QTARRLEKACRAGDAAEARSVLVEWCRHRWPGQPGLSALRQRADSALARELDALDRSLYASADIAWDGKALNRMLKEQFLAEQHRTKTRHREDLTPLHRI
ncbi:MAG: BatD family protein, partial [Gammaproteobacteria bacterium]